MANAINHFLKQRASPLLVGTPKRKYFGSSTILQVRPENSSQGDSWVATVKLTRCWLL